MPAGAPSGENGPAGGGAGGPTSASEGAPNAASSGGKEHSNSRSVRGGGLLPSWKELGTVIVLALPLAVLYRQILVPYLASSSFVRNLKKQGVSESVLHSLRWMGLDVDAKDPNSWTGWFSLKLRDCLISLAMWFSNASSLQLGLAALGLLVGLIALEAALSWCCRPKEDPELAKLNREFMRLDKEVDDALKEIMAMLPPSERAAMRERIRQAHADVDEEMKRHPYNTGKSWRPGDPGGNATVGGKFSGNRGSEGGSGVGRAAAGAGPRKKPKPAGQAGGATNQTAAAHPSTCNDENSGKHESSIGTGPSTVRRRARRRDG